MLQPPCRRPLTASAAYAESQRRSHAAVRPQGFIEKQFLSTISKKTCSCGTYSGWSANKVECASGRAGSKPQPQGISGGAVVSAEAVASKRLVLPHHDLKTDLVASGAHPASVRPWITARRSVPTNVQSAAVLQRLAAAQFAAGC